MTVYVLYDYFLPAFKAGGPIQSLSNMIAELKSEVEMKVITSHRDHDGTELAIECDQWTTFSDTPVYYTTRGFGSIKKAIVDRDAVLFINGMYSLKFNFLPALFLTGRKIVSARGMLHPGALSQKSVKKKIYLALWKLLRLNTRCEYHATSVEEKEFIQQVLGSDARVWVAPNLPRVLHYQHHAPKKQGCITLCSVALISPMKNLLNVLVALKKTKAQVVYDIWGPVKDSQYWDQCNKEISGMPSNVCVNYRGELQPYLVPQALRNTDVFIQPSKSENFGHSLFEALTAGKPLITSHSTPWNSLYESNAGINVDPENSNEILEAVEFFASMNDERLHNWSECARNYAIRSINIEAIRRQYLNMFNNTFSNQVNKSS